MGSKGRNLTMMPDGFEGKKSTHKARCDAHLEVRMITRVGAKWVLSLADEHEAETWKS